MEYDYDRIDELFDMYDDIDVCSEPDVDYDDYDNEESDEIRDIENDYMRDYESHGNNPYKF